jgi:hypothetical protein
MYRGVKSIINADKQYIQAKGKDSYICTGLPIWLKEISARNAHDGRVEPALTTNRCLVSFVLFFCFYFRPFVFYFFMSLLALF